MTAEICICGHDVADHLARDKRPCIGCQCSEFKLPPEPPGWLHEWRPEIDRNFQFIFKNPKTGEVHWKSNRGPQTWLLLCPYDEILIGGRRGGSKTAGLIAWFAMGDPSLDPDDPARATLLNDPYFRGLIVRKEYRAMSEFVDECMDFFRPFNVVKKDDPAEFHFNVQKNGQSGAIIYTDHLNNSEAYEKYRGSGMTKIGIEELVQIEEEDSYVKLFGSLRGKKQVRIINGRQRELLHCQIMATTNPDGPGACVPYGEVMTPSGWVDIKTMDVGDPVFTLNPNGEIVVSHVEQVHKGPRSGPMCYVNMRGFHLACTPEHSVAKIRGVRPGRNTRDGIDPIFSLVPFQSLPGQAQILRTGWWSGNPLGDFVAPLCETRIRKLKQPARLPEKLFCSFLGWYLSEGWFVDRDKAFGISQKKEQGRKKLKKLLDECGFVFGWGPRGALCHAPDWWLYLRQFGHAKEKFIPEWVKGAPQESLQCLLDALMDGDGHWETDGISGAYYTISKQLADDVCEISLKLGYTVYLSRRVRHHSDNIAYQVNLKRNKIGGIEFQTGNHVYDVDTRAKRSPAVEVRHSNKPVYCIGVPDTHTFFIRQHGAVWVSGNSWVKSRFIKMMDRAGNLIPPNTPVRNPISGLSRIFIPMKLDDNPYYRDNKQYMGMLLEQSPLLQKQWIEGDWDAAAGRFFVDFRPDGPIGEKEAAETPWACHVI